MGFLIVIVVLFAFMWLLLIRPQRRRQVQQAEMLAGLAPGDEIVTAGGLYGQIESIGEEDLMLEVAPGTSVRIARRAVAALTAPEDEDEDELDEELEPPEEPEPEVGARAGAATRPPSD